MSQLHYRDIQPGTKQCIVLHAPRVASMLTAVIDIRQFRNGAIRLTYTDLSEEFYKPKRGECAPNIADMTHTEVVSFVQSKRVAANTQTPV